MTATPRIRWTDEEDGGFTGYVGTVEADLFRIWPPDNRDPEWILTHDFPGHPGRRIYNDDPDKLKGFAEEWLAEFASSLGAIFPDDTGNRWQALKDDLTGRIGYDLVSHQAALGAGEDIAAASYGGLVSANRSTLAKMRELEAG